MRWQFFGTLLCTAFLSFFSMNAVAQLNGGPTRPQVALPEGPLRNIILKNCVSCHGIDDYAFHALSREKWGELLGTVHQGQEMKKLSSQDENLLLEYLATTFGTESAPFPRQYIPPQIDTYFADEEGRQMLDVVCTECHELDRVYETRASLPRWRVLVVEMRQRGAFLPDDANMERLIEWLSRVQSANLFE
ncbi:MAG: hypothetical protein RLZZ227_1787 [Pseudomonadota bacterium]|jgi:mono/diheme cytochrome c family protein